MLWTIVAILLLIVLVPLAWVVLDELLGELWYVIWYTAIWIAGTLGALWLFGAFG